jgi:hypothetical protein
MTRTIRYQGAIVQDGQILLIKHTEHENGRGFGRERPARTGRPAAAAMRYR